MARQAMWLLALAVAVAWAQADQGAETLLVKLDSESSIREVYRELGWEFDLVESEARRAEMQQECFMSISRQFGNHPRLARFFGFAYRQDDPTRTLIPVCHALRPYDDRMAREVCESLNRPLLENRLMELSFTCGPRATPPEAPTDSSGRGPGDRP
jgi:hypothetical protein